MTSESKSVQHTIHLFFFSLSLLTLRRRPVALCRLETCDPATFWKSEPGLRKTFKTGSLPSCFSFQEQDRNRQEQEAGRTRDWTRLKSDQRRLKWEWGHLEEKRLRSVEPLLPSRPPLLDLRLHSRQKKRKRKKERKSEASVLALAVCRPVAMSEKRLELDCAQEK